MLVVSAAVADSFLSAQKFPTTFEDLSFSAKQEFKSEDYELFSELSPYEKLNIVYMDRESAAEIAQDELNDMRTGTTTTNNATQQITQALQQTNTNLGNTGNSGNSAYCATKNPSIKAGQKVPIGKPVLDSHYRFCSGYGNRNFGTKEKPKWDPHYGFDIGCKEEHYGQPVFTTADGIVEKVKPNQFGSSAGNYIRINHKNGFKTYYMHLEKILVKPGQQVSAGCQIGTIGNTGGAKAFKGALQTDYPTMSKSISHLHYEIHYSGNESSVEGIKIKRGFSKSKSVDPAYFMGEKK
jgi:murein DD-endopeptidase MepM/ murein hydrolase activator NlpD